MGLGWNPRVTEQVTLWELVAAIDGHNRANDGEEQIEAPSDDEFDRMLGS
ncbi:phage tail assembly chaperone [Bradyrhizobium sp. USDA 4452]